MAKRFSHFQPNSFVNKKPKLDISFGRRDSNNDANVKRSNVIPPKNPRLFPSDNLFDDADDDVILLASQSVEADQQREQFSQQVVMNTSITDISFSKFAHDASTSTQLINKSRVDPPKNCANDAFDNIEKYFEDEIEIESEQIIEAHAFKPPNPVGKIPTTKTITTTNNSNRQLIDNGKSSKELKSLTSQINYLTDKTATYKEQIEKLTQDASEFNDKIQTKDGEVSMVRYQMRQLQQQNECLRLEKMQEIDNIKKEWQEKIGELEKLIESQKNELDFKNVEIVNLKSSRLNDSQRSIEYVDTKKDFKNVAFLYNLHLDLGRMAQRNLRQMPPELFIKSSVSDENLRFRDAVFKKELDNLQSGLSQMQIMQSSSVSISSVEVKMITSLKHTIKVLLSYVQKLEFMKYTDTNASVEYKFLCEEPQDDEKNCLIHPIDTNVFHEAKIYPSEKADIPRRLIAAFAIACKYSETLCSSLVTEKIGSSSLLEIILEILNLLGYSKELFSHFGLLESLEHLLLSFIENAPETPTNFTLIGQYIRSLVFCRLGFRPLAKLSECLLRISTKFTDNTTINSLCIECPLGSFVFNEYYKIIQFSPRSCTMQVYGSLLETAFPQDISLTYAQTKFLLQISHNHIIFLRNCFERNVKWILKADSSAKDCDCYAKAINSAVILIHLVLKEWTCDPKRMDSRTVAVISRNGILLLYDAFYKNYRRDVLQNGGSSVKNRLHMIHDWLTEYKTIFQFKSAHAYALQSIMLSHIIANPIRMDDLTTPKPVQGNDQIWDEIFESFV